MSHRRFALLLGLAVLAAPTTARACGGYGMSIPRDSLILQLADRNPLVVMQAWAQVATLGNEGVRRLERVVVAAERAARFHERDHQHLSRALDKRRAEGGDVKGFKEELRCIRGDADEARRIVTRLKPLIAPLKATVDARAPTA